jgi:VIT1/CCC1 family predicted Fe2+/Mn2+ transporter
VPQSEEAKRILTEEVREIAGDDAAGRARERLEGGPLRREPRSLRAVLASNRLLLIVSFALAVMLGAIAALALHSWWILAVPLLLHGALTTVVVMAAGAMTTKAEKPDPVAVARLEEEGVADPEGELDQLVEYAAGEQSSGGNPAD